MIHPHNIYIHVPFCMSKCNYCAFFSHACANPDWDSYTREIISEIDDFVTQIGCFDVPTIFFGGGTPSLMPVKYFDAIISHLGTKTHIAPDAEITIEANPNTIDAKKLNDFIAAGVNRISFGVQSLDDARLKFLGRRHNAKMALDILGVALARGIRTSCDFIYGLPMDSTDSVIQMCQNINSLGINHCSMYELTVEPDTPFGKMNLSMPSNADMAEMYNAIDATLHLPRYEVSNYATYGNECRHNMNVWDGDAYLGLGRGAAGRVLINDTWYEQRGASEQFAPMSNTTRALEKIITGLRQMRGLRLTPDVMEILNMDFIKSCPDLLTISGNRLTATKKGLLILDNLLVKLAG